MTSKCKYYLEEAVNHLKDLHVNNPTVLCIVNDNMNCLEIELIFQITNLPKNSI